MRDVKKLGNKNSHACEFIFYDESIYDLVVMPSLFNMSIISECNELSSIAPGNVKVTVSFASGNMPFGVPESSGINVNVSLMSSWKI